MKKLVSILMVIVLLLSISAFGTGAQTPGVNTGSPLTLQFTSSMESKKCRVTGIKASKSGNSILFSMSYETDVKREYCVFNPPEGNLFKIKDTTSLSAGKRTRQFKVSADKLSRVASFTISLYKMNSNERNFIYVDTPQLKSLMNTEQANRLESLLPKKEGTPVQMVEKKTDELAMVRFDFPVSFQSSIQSEKLKVTGLKAAMLGEEIAFAMDYESDARGSYYVFDPPNGNLFMIRGVMGMPAGKQTVRFKVAADKLNQTNEVTVTLVKSNSNKNNYIFFHTEQLNSLWEGEPENTQDAAGGQDPAAASGSSPSKVPADEFDNVSFDTPVAFSNFKHNPECTVTSLKAGKLGDCIAFCMEYESDAPRIFSIFDPPSGKVLNVSDSKGLPAGKQSKKFKLGADRLSKTVSVALNLSGPGTGGEYYVSFATSQLLSLMNQEQKNTQMALETKSSAEKNYSEFDNVAFDVSISPLTVFESHDCSIKSLKAGRMGDYVAFSMEYESEVQRGYSIFNPPLGDIFMVVDSEGLPAGTHTVKFKVEKSKLKMVENITIKLFRYTSENNFASFKSSQLSSLLE